MARMEEVELTNMCMVCDGKGNVLVQNKKGDRTWHGWNFPGGHVEQGEFVTPSVIREVREETGLTVENLKPPEVWHRRAQEHSRGSSRSQHALLLPVLC